MVLAILCFEIYYGCCYRRNYGYKVNIYYLFAAINLIDFVLNAFFDFYYYLFFAFSFVLVMEIIGTKWRELISVLYQVPFNLGHLTLPLFAYFFRDWHHLQFALSIPSVILISYYWLVPESPRWLFTVGRIDDSANVLEKAATFNKRPTESIKLNLEKYAISTNTKAGGARGNILDLVRTPNMRTKTISMCFNWMVCGEFAHFLRSEWFYSPWTVANT